MHDKSKVEIHNINKNENENENINKNTIKVEVLKPNKNEIQKNLRFNIKETIINSKNTNLENQNLYTKNNLNDSNNVNINNNSQNSYKKNYQERDNINNNTNINYQYQPIKKNQEKDNINNNTNINYQYQPIKKNQERDNINNNTNINYQYQPIKKNQERDNINNNTNINYQYQPIKKNEYEYSYSKIYSHHPPLHPHSFSIKSGMDIRQLHHHHHHHHQHRYGPHNGMKRISEHRKKNTDFIDNLNSQFKYHFESSTDITPPEEKKASKKEANINEDIRLNNQFNNDNNNIIKMNISNQQDNHNQRRYHQHYHPYSHLYDYPNLPSNTNEDKENKQGRKKKDFFDLSDIKVVLEAQSNEPLKKSVSFSIENDDLRCPSNKPYHLKQRMENRQRMNSRNYEILANTKDLMLEKELNEREIKFFCLRNMQQNAHQKHTEFINQRKEKIQNHSKHIDSVRRQNCLDRSKWRCDRSQKMNHRQLKVEQNRRKIINNKKALYASLVEKAKKVVIDLKKSEELEKLQRLENLNEKMDESEQRRQVLMYTAKSKILDVSSSLYHQQKLEKKAALQIQRWWRKKIFETPLNNFIELDITSDAAKTLSFEKLHEKLHSNETMEITKKLLNCIFKADITNQKNENIINNTNEKINENFIDNKSLLLTNNNNNSTEKNVNIQSNKVTSSNKEKNETTNNKHFSEEKMFLSAFMIYGHSKIVISSLGETEKELIVLSEKMLKKFEYMVFSYNQPSFYKALQEFNEIWKEFLNKFKFWKKKDSEALLEILIQHWIEMEKLWFSVKDYEAANTWQTKIVVQQRNIKKKIETLAGRSGILKLIKITHKSRETKFPNVKFKPNVMPSPYLFPIDKNGKTTINQNSVIGPLDKSYIHDETEKFDTVHTSATNSNKDDSDKNNTDTTPATEKVKGTEKDKGKENENEKENEKEKEKEKEKENRNENGNRNENENKNESTNGKCENDSRDIDEIFVKNLLNKYNNRFSNFQLAHEIILNPEFQFDYYNEDNEEEEEKKKTNENLTENPNNNYNKIISKVTKIAQKAFFDMVQESFDSGKENQFIPGIVKDIKDRLLFLTNKDKKTYNQVNEVLDEKLILQQIQHGETNFDNIFNYIVDTMLQLCAPARDEAIKKIYAMEKPVQKIKGILNQLDNMKIDLANYNIKKFRPYLKEIAVDYERKKFKEAIETNLINLEYTETWISQSVIRLIKNQNNIKYATKDLKKKRKENQTRYIDIYNDAFLSLLFKRKIFENEKKLVTSNNNKTKMKGSISNNSDSDLSENSLSNNKSNITPSKSSSSTLNCSSTEDERFNSNNKSFEPKSNKNVSYIPVLKKNDEIVLPETLMFDFNRILEYQQSIRNFSIVAAITILCQSIIPYLHGKEFIIKNIYLELLDYIENNLPQLQKKKPSSSNKDDSNNINNSHNNNTNSSTSTIITDTKGESNGGEEGKKKNKMDKESKLNSLMADFAKYIITKIESIILDSIIKYNSETTNYVKLEPKILSANEKVLLKKMIINTLLLNNNMYSIINRQIMSLLLHYLKTGEYKTDTLERFCLYYSKDKLHATFSKIKLFTEYNRDVYSEYYDQIMAKLLIINKIYSS